MTSNNDFPEFPESEDVVGVRGMVCYGERLDQGECAGAVSADRNSNVNGPG